MASINKVIIVGNLGRDPEVRYMPSGDAIANIAVATSYKYKDKTTGEPKELTEWHRISFFGRLAEIVGQYLVKGSSIYVEGRLQTRKYQKDGVDHYATEIIGESMQMLGGRQGGGNDGADDGERQAPQQRQQQGQRQQAPQRQQGQQSDRERALNRQHAASKQGGAPAPNFSDMDDDIPFAFDNTLLSPHTKSSQYMRAKNGPGLHLARENAVEF